MANLGTLTLDLVARTGSFVQGMDQAERSSQKWRKQVEEDLAAVARASGAAIGAAAAATTALVVSQVQAATELRLQAQLAAATTQEFQRYAIAAETVGIEQEALASQLKDFNEKTGEFLSSGGGEMADFFEQIAPQVGITADAFRGLSGPQGLQLYYDSLEKAGLSQQQMSFYLESMASDATALIPLLRNGGEGFKLLGDAAEQSGAIMSEKTVTAAEQLSAAAWVAQQTLAGFRNQISENLLPTLATLADLFMDSAREAGGMGNVVQDSVQTAVKSLAFLADAADGVKRVFTLVADGIILVLNEIAATAALVAYRVVETLNSIPGVDYSDELKAIGDFGRTANSVVKEAAANMQRTLDEPLAGAKLLALYEKSQKAGQEGGGSDDSDKIAEFFKKMREEATKSGPGLATFSDEANEAADAIGSFGTKASKTADAIGDLIKSLELESATFGKSRKEQVLYKAALDSANDPRLAQVSALLSTIEAHEEADKAAKAYADTVRSLRTDEERRTDTLREQLEVIRAAADIPQADKDKAESRAVQSAIGSDDKPDFAGADGAMGELFKLDQQEEDLNKWYEKRLEMLDEFRAQFAEKELEWDAAELEAKQYHIEQLQAIDDARRDVLLASTEDMFSNAAALTKQFAGENSKA